MIAGKEIQILSDLFASVENDHVPLIKEMFGRVGMDIEHDVHG